MVSTKECVVGLESKERYGEQGVVSRVWSILNSERGMDSIKECMVALESGERYG